MTVRARSDTSTMVSVKRLWFLVIAAACKEEPAKPPPPVEGSKVLDLAFADPASVFVPSELIFQGVTADGTFATLVIERKRRVSTGTYNPRDNCPRTTWSSGVVTENTNAACTGAVALQRPRCSVAEVRARAAEEGAAATELAMMKIGGMQSPHYDGPHWSVTVGKERFEYADDCLTAERGSGFARRLPMPVTNPVTADELTRLATAWLAEKHPTLITDQISVVGVRADGTLDPTKGGYWYAPGVVWPDDKPTLDLHHYGGRAPFGICKPLTWTAARGWRLDYDASCADITGSPTCTVSAIWRRAIADGEPDTRLAKVTYRSGAWTFQTEGGTRTYREPCE